MNERLRKIINHFGVRHQIKKLSEEVFELQEAIIEREMHWNYDTEIQDIKSYDSHIEEEFADCMVLLEQIQEFYNLREEKIKSIMEYKVNRTLERIGKKTKKVFSKEKFIENRKNSRDTDEKIKFALEKWANKCDGLTKEEMNELGYSTSDSWMIEVKEKEIKYE